MTDNTAPATLAQIEQLLQPIKDQMVTKDDLTRVATSLNKEIDQVLDVLVSTDQRLTGEVKNHEIRIKRLERKTGLAKVAA